MSASGTATRSRSADFSLFDRLGPGAFPAYRQQLRKQGARCLVSGGGSGFLPPLGQYGPSFVAYFPIPPFPGAIIQLEEQHGWLLAAVSVRWQGGVSLLRALRSIPDKVR